MELLKLTFVTRILALKLYTLFLTVVSNPSMMRNDTIEAARPTESVMMAIPWMADESPDLCPG